MRTLKFIVAMLGLASPAFAIDAFNFTVTPATSTVSYTVSAAAPFTGNMTGDTTATPPTRLKHGSFGFPSVNCGTWTPTINENIVVSGSINASGSGNNIHPTGAFKLAIDTAANTASAQNLVLNLLGSSTASITASLANFRYETFCSMDPVCSQAFLFAITLPVGNATVSAITAAQTPGIASGTITPNGANSWNFSIPMTAEVSANATFTGSPLPVTPQVLPIVFTGVITVTGNTASMTSTIMLDLAPPANTTATDLPALPFTTPAGIPLVCGGLNVTLTLTISSSTFTTSTTTNLAAAGTRIACRCDWNTSGAVSLQDIFDFLTSYFNNAADFNADSTTTLQDIFDFLTCYFRRPLGC